jgi:hypothetical protein
MNFTSVDETNFIFNYVEGPRSFLSSSYQPPRVIAAHLFTDAAFKRLVKNVRKDSLIIYVHREESDRLLSAIKHVAYMSKASAAKEIFEEDELEELIVNSVRNADNEMGYGATRILTCNLWNEIDETGPNIAFVDYRDSSALQDLLAEFYCPDQPSVRVNRAADTEYKGGRTKSVRLKDGSDVDLVDWLAAKREVLDFALSSSSESSCKRKNHFLEESLFSCKDDDDDDDDDDEELKAIRVLPIIDLFDF